MSNNTPSITSKTSLFTIGFTIALIAAALTGLTIGASLSDKPVNRVSNAAACSCNPPPEQFNGWTDNFCFHPPSTTNCPMTQPGGYCDPNGDGSYEDGDWVRGFNEYRTQCGIPTPSGSQPSGGPISSVPSSTPGAPQPTGIGTTSTPPPCVTSVPGGTTVPIVSITPPIIVSPTPGAPLGCKMLQESGDPSTKYDVVLMPVFYPDEATYAADSAAVVAKFNASNLGAMLNKINIVTITSLTEDYSTSPCSTNGRTLPCWDDAQATQAMRQCNGDSYMMIVNTDSPARWGSIGGITLGLGQPKMLVLSYSLNSSVHELGHALASATDEYSYHQEYDPRNGGSEPLNCATSPSNSNTEACPKWSAQFPNVGCYAGCGYTNWYRPENRSIMFASITDTFNEPTLFLFEQALQNFQ